ncbi:hypothetical protein [Streptomyces sp. NBC_00273]|uniref:hypothetical protein n=1 Tax=Streptomyces sp. NBC_00273 TaxID=2903644 RepID=UPI002E2DDCF3|nr:hypothetical protein [Streptomyces sp. NBC_00273]
MRWTALVSKVVVAAAAGAFLAVSAAGAQPPRQATDTDPVREAPAGGQGAAPEPGPPGTSTRTSPTPPASPRATSRTSPPPSSAAPGHGSAAPTSGPSGR